MQIKPDNLEKGQYFSHQKWFLLLFVISLFPLFFATKSAFTVFTQTKDRKEKVIKKYTFDNEPIEFLNLESDGQTIKSGEKFIREDEWLKDFTIRFKNITGKSIVYLSIVVMFPETGLNGSPQVYFLKYGTNQDLPNANQLVSLPPNESAEVKFSDEEFTHLKEFLATRKQLTELTEADYRIMVVHFADGTKWSGGTTFRPDPNKKGKFIPDNGEIKEEK